MYILSFRRFMTNGVMLYRFLWDFLVNTIYSSINQIDFFMDYSLSTFFNDYEIFDKSSRIFFEDEKTFP